jgi:hypothetical protein
VVNVMLKHRGSMPPTLDSALVQRLAWHVDRLAGLIGPRHLGKPAAFAAAAALVEREFADAGYDVTRQSSLGRPIRRAVRNSVE